MRYNIHLIKTIIVSNRPLKIKVSEILLNKVVRANQLAVELMIVELMLVESMLVEVI